MSGDFITKKTAFFLLFVIILGLSSISFIFFPSIFDISTNNPAEDQSFDPNPYENRSFIDVLADNIFSGGVPKDGIPAINNPQYINRIEADLLLEDSDIIFGLVFEGEIIAFPQRIVVYHEIINTRGNETKISITYCPLTGSALGFVAHVNSRETTFGTSGKLVNSNLVMYDRLTGSYWPQIIGQAVMGEGTNTTLEKVQLLWTNWGLWKAKYPDTLVLSDETGYIRPYGNDPYGSYENPNSFYNSGGPIFSTLYFDPQLPEKSVVIGVQLNQSYLAVEKELIRQEKIINTDLGNQSIVIFYDKSLDVARVYYSKVNGQDYTFSINNGSIVDDQTNNKWTTLGTSDIGILDPIFYFDVMWFAWVSFFPDTLLIM
ncbi:MAG: hypothetical protein HeimC3_38010 [Candidatus Heimdallarchaeota archaeon LC_3]|nr:MAG: hypothetical protein HeimC3_38010 [Candidatus Heimdallarchaeota archaeon LC_3]